MVSQVSNTVTGIGSMGTHLSFNTHFRKWMTIGSLGTDSDGVPAVIQRGNWSYEAIVSRALRLRRTCSAAVRYADAACTTCMVCGCWCRCWCWCSRLGCPSGTRCQTILPIGSRANSFGTLAALPIQPMGATATPVCSMAAVAIHLLGRSARAPSYFSPSSGR